MGWLGSSIYPVLRFFPHSCSFSQALFSAIFFLHSASLKLAKERSDNEKQWLCRVREKKIKKEEDMAVCINHCVFYIRSFRPITSHPIRNLENRKKTNEIPKPQKIFARIGCEYHDVDMLSVIWRRWFFIRWHHRSLSNNIVVSHVVAGIWLKWNTSELVVCFDFI